MAKKKPHARMKVRSNPRKVSIFAPLLSRAEKETVKHMTQHQRVVYLRSIRES